MYWSVCPYRPVIFSFTPFLHASHAALVATADHDAAFEEERDRVDAALEALGDEEWREVGREVEAFLGGLGR